jgi:multiple sugar transport system permease protein
MRRAGWYAGTAAVLVVALLPVLWIVSLSLKSPATITDKRLWPVDPTLENYRSIAGSALFTRALLNSVGIGLITTVLAVALATPAAYALTRLRFRGKALVLPLTLAVAVFPPMALVGSLFDLWRELGLYDTWPGLIIPYLSLTLPISIWTLAAFFQQIPWELEQAAQVDGATPLQAFRKVIVPLAAPGVFTTAIIAFFIAWNDFVYGISLTSTEAARPVPAALAFFTGASQFESPTGAISAAAIIVTIPVVLLVMLFQKQIVAGLTSGAVKG